MRIQILNIINWLFNKAQYISGLSFVLLTIIDISNWNEITIDAFGIPTLQIGKILYFIAVIIAIVFGIFAVSKSKEVEELEINIAEKGEKIVELEDAISNIISDTDELFNSYLKLIINNLEFKHTERISVYKVIENKFILLGRTSENPRLMEKGRSNYPINEGFIAKGWEEKQFYINNLPEPNGSKSNDYYKAVNKISKIDKTVVQNMKMKSRNYYVKRIDGLDNQPKAVIVCESKSPNKFSKEDIEDKISEVEQPLVMFIENNNKHKYTNINNNLGL